MKTKVPLYEMVGGGSYSQVCRNHHKIYIWTNLSNMHPDAQGSFQSDAKADVLMFLNITLDGKQVAALLRWFGAKVE